MTWPGLLYRYFSESAATLACMVFGVRDCVHTDGTCTRDYWITDGKLFAIDQCIHGASQDSVNIAEFLKPLQWA